MPKKLNPSEGKKALVQDIRTIINQARTQIKQVVNSAMVLAYWQIGQRIIEEEQLGQERAGYGQHQLKQISQQLIQEYGKGFDVTNLRNMRRFYLAFPKWETLSLELSWSHYNRLARIENPDTRAWYLQESCAPYECDFNNFISSRLSFSGSLLADQYFDTKF